jgi:hypothetical protein
VIELGWARALPPPIPDLLGEEPPPSSAGLDDFNDIAGQGPRAGLDDFNDGVRAPVDWVGSDDFDDVMAPLEDDELPQLDIVTLDDFVAVHEPGSESLVGAAGDAVIPQGGDVMFYGDGGAGKTTLAIDLACHLAAGDDWLGLPVARPVRVLLIENEGPRPLFRPKLERKRDGWSGSPLEDRVCVLEQPWGKLSLAEEGWRRALAAALQANEIDVVVAGPVARLGMNEAGTLQEVRDFMGLVDEVREHSGRRVAVVLIHHENKGGKVSGAWEGAGDTLLHVSGQGPGSLRLYVQKARWSSSHHATTLQLRWTEGEGFAVEDKPELDDAAIAEAIVAYVREHAGTGWTKVEEAIKGVGAEKIRAVRDGLLGREIVNVDNNEIRELQERRAAHLYVSEDPTIKHLRQASDAAPTQPELPT